MKYQKQNFFINVKGALFHVSLIIAGKSTKIIDYVTRKLTVLIMRTNVNGDIYF